MTPAVVLLALALSLARPSRAGDLAAKAPAPEDLGPSVIDVSSYPEPYQKTYRELFIPIFSKHGGLARAVNWPIIELDARLEERERRDHPQLFENPRIAEVSRDGWKVLVRKLWTTPACCGGCPALTLPHARRLWRFLAYDSIQRKTGARAEAWIALRKDLLARFDKKHPIIKETGK